MNKYTYTCLYDTKVDHLFVLLLSKLGAPKNFVWGGIPTCEFQIMDWPKGCLKTMQRLVFFLGKISYVLIFPNVPYLKGQGFSNYIA